MKEKLISLLLLLAAGLMSASAQDKAELSFGTDLLSRYVWRGQDMGSCSVQPYLGVRWKGLSLHAEGNIGLVDRSDPEEIDLMLSYTTHGFFFGLADYWSDTPYKQYFMYKAHHTSHVFEAFAGYDFGFLQATWRTNFAGNDGMNDSGHRAYSSYLELTAPFRLLSCDWEAEAGIVPYATTYYRAPRFTMVALALKATKEIRISDHFSLPLFAQVMTNPECRRAYLIVGLTLGVGQ